MKANISFVIFMLLSIVTGCIFMDIVLDNYSTFKIILLIISGICCIGGLFKASTYII